jgi:hypothetical protein
LHLLQFAEIGQKAGSGGRRAEWAQSASFEENIFTRGYGQKRKKS